MIMMGTARAQQNLCPKCRNSLRLIVETENKSQVSTITYIYACDVCRYRKVVESITLKRDSNKLVVLKRLAMN